MNFYKHISSLLKCQNDFEQIIIYMDRDLLPKCNAIDSQVSGNQVLVSPCQKIIKYLKHMQNGSYEENYKIDGCRYLNYYINRQVNSAYGNPLTEVPYKTFIEAFKSKYSELNACNDNIKYIDKNVVANIKKILDMYEKLNKVINHPNPTSNDTCNNIDECLDIYMRFEPQCKNGNENQLCDALENFRKYSFDSSLDKKCKDKKTFPSFKVPQEKIPDLEGLGTPDDSSQMSDSLGEDDSSSKSSKTITAVSTTLLLFPLLFSLYKFTPLGSLIRPYIQRNQKVQYNANDEMLQLYLPNYKAQDNINKEQL
ncbi:PIR protein, partial [Plasmodium vivax]